MYYYVYPLRSAAHPDQTYTGFTHDLRKRLAEHNKFKPWILVAYIALPEKHLAKEMEEYLKSGSGRAFANRHLLTQNGQKS